MGTKSDHWYRVHLNMKARPGEFGSRYSIKQLEILMIVAGKNISQTLEAIQAFDPDPPAAEVDPDPEPLEDVFAARLITGR